MYRVLISMLIVIMISVSAVPAMGQAGRFRLNTQVEGRKQERAPSFRGGQQLDDLEQQGPGMQVPTRDGSGGMMMETGYNVHVLGEVRHPGTYTIPASARLAQAIQFAGGIADNGSERNIELRRKGGQVRSVDLLLFKVFGKLSNNPYLADNDVVFVPLRDRVIQVVGAVKRPEMYELKNEKNLTDVIKLAGGFNNAVAKGEPVRVIRFNEGKKNVEEVPIDPTAMNEFSVVTGDVVVVPNVVTKDTKFDYNVAAIPGDQVFYPSYEDRVFVLGGVAYPGAYPFSPYYTLSQYITLAGGISDRGADKYKVTGIDGKTHSAKLNERVNPGDTIMVKQKVMSNAAWAGFGLSVASFGLAASSTIIAISR